MHQPQMCSTQQLLNHGVPKNIKQITKKKANKHWSLTGRLLIRLPRPRAQRQSGVRAQEDPLPVWPGVGRAGAQRGRSVHALRAARQHHPQHRPQRCERQERCEREDRLHPSPLLPERQPAGCDQRESGQRYQLPAEEAVADIPGRVQRVEGDASVSG